MRPRKYHTSAITGSMFKKETNRKQETVKVTLDGESRELQSGVSVAAALLADGQIVSRISPASHKPCAPHCLMGVCFECQMEIDGVQQQSCMVQVEEGQEINRRLTGSEAEKK